MRTVSRSSLAMLAMSVAFVGCTRDFDAATPSPPGAADSAKGLAITGPNQVLLEVPGMH